MAPCLIPVYRSAEVDPTFPAENRRKAVDILIERKATYHVQLFSTVRHGFALRGNPDVPIERESFCVHVDSSRFDVEFSRM